jgi:hypothetical protein
LNEAEVLHIGPSKVRRLNLHIILEPVRNPLVLRPNFTKQERLEVIQNAQELIGQPYDVFRVYNFLFR